MESGSPGALAREDELHANDVAEPAEPLHQRLCGNSTATVQLTPRAPFSAIEKERSNAGWQPNASKNVSWHPKCEQERRGSGKRQGMMQGEARQTGWA